MEDLVDLVQADAFTDVTKLVEATHDTILATHDTILATYDMILATHDTILATHDKILATHDTILATSNISWKPKCWPLDFLVWMQHCLRTLFIIELRCKSSELLSEL